VCLCRHGVSEWYWMGCFFYVLVGGVGLAFGLVGWSFVCLCLWRVLIVKSVLWGVDGGGEGVVWLVRKEIFVDLCCRLVVCFVMVW